MPCDNDKELFPVVDAEGQVTGCATRGECHGGAMLLHPVVHLHLFDPNGALYLQKRSAWKDIQPGRWDTAVGGHVDFGETIDEALRREARPSAELDGGRFWSPEEIVRMKGRGVFTPNFEGEVGAVLHLPRRECCGTE